MIKEEITHFSLSIIAGVIIGYLTSNYYAILIALVSGFFIDFDHLIDYCIYTKFQKFNLKEFLSGKFFDYSGKVYVVFHGYEYILIFLIVALAVPSLNWFFYSLALSHLLHLIYDTISNKPKWPTYFIIYRAINNFDHSKFDFKKGE